MPAESQSPRVMRRVRGIEGTVRMQIDLREFQVTAGQTGALASRFQK